jgi:hypothetical protein
MATFISRAGTRACRRPTTAAEVHVKLCIAMIDTDTMLTKVPSMVCGREKRYSASQAAARCSSCADKLRATGVLLSPAAAAQM